MSALARAACARVGVPADDLQSVRLHSNGVFRLAQQRIIVRVGGGADAAGRAQRAVIVTRWLREWDYPTVAPASLVQPVLLTDQDGAETAVTFWRQVEVEPGPVAAGELGGLLHRLHRIPEPPVELPAFRPLNRLVAAARTSLWLGESDRRWLSDRATDLGRAMSTAAFRLGPAGLVHGDAQLGNAIRVPGRGVVLADWDSVASAPREWDLVPTAVEQRFGGSPELLDELLAAYGADPTQQSGWDVLRDVYELRSVAAHIRRAPVSPPHAVEAARRIASLRSGDRHARWYPVG